MQNLPKPKIGDISAITITSGLHQTTIFSNPTITFFASDMKDKIEKLKKEGLNDFTEKGGQSNIIVITPEKQHINLFKSGM